MKWFAVLAVALAAAAACGGDDDTGDGNGASGGVGTLSVTSEEFENGGEIPEDFSCDGRNHSPPLRWGSRPGGTESLVVVVDDEDAAGFVHWLVYDLDPALGGLDFIGQTERLPGSGAPQGHNSTGQPGYTGPCPPQGDGPHTYSFRVYALDTTLGLEPGASVEQVQAAMEGRVLASGELRGTFGR